MFQTAFTPWLSLAGGLLIGLSAVLLMAIHGRIAGLSGMFATLLDRPSAANGWRLAFLAGAILSPVLLALAGVQVAVRVPVSTAALIVGGIVVGVGVTLGAGCTSGHGVCGMARLSPRSLIATVAFMTTGFLTVFIIRHAIGA